MLEHDSHTGSRPGRQAIDVLGHLRRGGGARNGYGKPANDAGIETIVEVADDLAAPHVRVRFGGARPRPVN
jgi:hypothetical protein